jgi:hypothetical protein
VAAQQHINEQQASSDRTSTDAVVTVHRNGSMHSGFSAKEAVQNIFRKPS